MLLFVRKRLFRLHLSDWNATDRCLEMGKLLPPPVVANPITGYPIAGEGSSYLGLCEFACRHGYCPPTACGTVKLPLVEPTVSPFLPFYCVSISPLHKLQMSRVSINATLLDWRDESSRIARIQGVVRLFLRRVSKAHRHMISLLQPIFNAMEWMMC